MGRLPSIGNDLTGQLRDTDRRLAENDAAIRTGVVAYQILATNNGPHAGPGTNTTDFAIADVRVSSAVLYVVHLQTAKTMTAAGNWGFFFYVDTVQTLKLGHWNEVDATFALENNEHYAKLWKPATGIYDIDVRVVEESVSGDLTLPADGVDTREFWVEAAGLR